MSYVAEAVDNAFQPQKLNYELLGNTDPHLHWHIFPRHDDDPRPDEPVWVVDKATRYSDSAKPDSQELTALKCDLLDELQTTEATIQNSTEV